MSSLIPYLTENKGNLGVSTPKTKNKNYVSTQSNYFNLTTDGRYKNTKNGIGTGVEPMTAKDISALKSSKNYVGNKAIDGAMTIAEVINKLNKTLNLPTDDLNTHAKILKNDSTYYNRFKIANPNSQMIKGYPHVFFVSPMCNILTTNGLHNQFSGNDLFEYVYKTSPEVIEDLSRYNQKRTDFSFLLSNYIKSFSLSDEYINTDTYGRTFTGYKISFGKNNIESKTAGTFDVTFSDTRNLDIYKFHRIWVEYISGTYRGIFSPRNEDILFKVLDYTGALYYILTAEDNESIIFWSKYYGVYPSTIPSTQYSWGEGNGVNTPDLSITYQYSWKEDFNPESLVDFNYNARVGDLDLSNGYSPVYDEKLGTVGDSFMSRPYIELIKDSATGEYQYKLRFQK